MRSCGKGSWNSALNFATIFCDGVFLVYLFIYLFIFIAHFRVGVCCLPECQESHEPAYKLGSPSKAVRYICSRTGHCAPLLMLT